jgi:hypothetical protein
LYRLLAIQIDDLTRYPAPVRLNAEVDISQPLALVFAAYRDELPELVPYLPNVRAITPTSRVERPGEVALVNHWEGGADLPAIARKFVSQELLSWDDHATWSEPAHTCRWRTEVAAFRDALRAEGETRFSALEQNTTRVTIEGEIAVDARKLRMVPRIFAGSVGPAIERFLVATIRPNLIAVARAVGQRLQERGG